MDTLIEKELNKNGKQISNQFGNPEDTIICFGYYEQRKHMKYKEPIKGRGNLSGVLDDT